MKVLDLMTRILDAQYSENAEAKSRRAEVFGWLSQRQAYLDEVFNGRKQSLTNATTEQVLSIDSVAKDPRAHSDERDYEWNEAAGEFTPKEPK